MPQRHVITPGDLGLDRTPITAAMSLEEVAGVIYRYAIAAAFVRHTSTRWVRDQDLLVRSFSIGQPGQHEVDLPKGEVWRPEAERIFDSKVTELRRLCRSVNGKGLQNETVS